MNKKVTFFLLIIFLLGCSYNSPHSKTNQEINAWSIIKDNFQDRVKKYRSENKLIIEYCPYNTCDAFVADASSERILSEFVLIFLSKVPTANNPNPIKLAKETSDSILMEIENNSAITCNGYKDINRTKCILEAMVKRYQIELEFVRYDEGQRNSGSEGIMNKIKELK